MLKTARSRGDSVSVIWICFFGFVDVPADAGSDFEFRNSDLSLKFAEVT